MKTSSAISIVGASPGLKTLYISFKASVLFKFLSILSVSSKYGPLLIGSILTSSSDFICSFFIFSIISSLKSEPEGRIILLLLSTKSFDVYFPTNSSLVINISFKFFSSNFFAITIFNFSPFDNNFLLLFASIRSKANLTGLLKLLISKLVIHLLFFSSYL